MKQLKFFTSRAETLRATESALTKGGIAKKKLHVFARENTQNRYDGLILASQNKQEQDALSSNVVIMAVVMLVGVIGLYYGIINFVAFGVLCMAVSMIPVVSKYLKASALVSNGHLNKVYFLVVDVDDTEENAVASILKNQDGLVPQ